MVLHKGPETLELDVIGTWLSTGVPNFLLSGELKKLEAQKCGMFREDKRAYAIGKDQVRFL